MLRINDLLLLLCYLDLVWAYQWTKLWAHLGIDESSSQECVADFLFPEFELLSTDVPIDKSTLSILDVKNYQIKTNR